jgi:hypothetical protein
MLGVAPTAARADGGMIETGTTTYEVVPGKNLIQVTIQISIYNATPNKVTSTGIEYIFWNLTEITVEQEAGPVSATSDAGAVSQSVISTDKYYRYIDLNYPRVYYGQTRVVTATYSIPAAPHAAGGFRAGQAYASLCAVGNGWDTGTVSVVLPTGFKLYVDDGSDLTQSNASGDKQVYSSGTQASPNKFWTCVDAEDAANLTHTPLTAAGQAFDIESWPEDASWSSSIRTDVGGESGEANLPDDARRHDHHPRGGRSAARGVRRPVQPKDDHRQHPRNRPRRHCGPRAGARLVQSIAVPGQVGDGGSGRLQRAGRRCR